MPFFVFVCSSGPVGFHCLFFFPGRHGSPTTIGMSSTHPLSRFHCMFSMVLKKASSKHMYCVERGGVECSRTMAAVSCTVIDCWRFTAGELVGNAPHLAWSPNMLPKQFPLGDPLSKKKESVIWCACAAIWQLITQNPNPPDAPEKPYALGRMHVRHDSIDMARSICAKVVNRHLIFVDPHDVVFHCIRSKSRYFPRAMGLYILRK